MHIRIGTRKSKLAIAQAEEVAQFLEKMHHSYEIITILTTGDKIKDKNLYDIGGKALFLKEIEEALLDNKIDIAVHSFKDVPAHIPQELKIAAVLERKTANDVLLCFKSNNIADLPYKAKIGTSSVRRKAQLLHHRPDLEILNCRGNVTSRIEKLMQQNYDAIVLAASGLERLNIWDPTYCNTIPEEEMLPAVAQGIIALEVRQNDTRMLETCQAINHQLTWELVQAERGFLEALNADCRTPVAALAKIDGDKVNGKFMLAAIDGTELYTHSEVFNIENGYNIGTKAAQLLLGTSTKKT
jgi:hydroxymethylbilane synthase